jgi:hypothetical protein
LPLERQESLKEIKRMFEKWYNIINK